MAEPQRKESAQESVRGAFNRAARTLASAGIETAGLDARLLLSHVTGLSQESFIAEPARLLDAADQARFDGLVGRRIAGEPVARILGFKEFWGRDFALGSETLVPRPESELLVEAGLAHLNDATPTARPRIADLGTGSGCLLVSLLADCPNAVGVGADLSLAALSVARANAARHGVADRACFLCADWLNALAQAFDLIVANPPYVPSAAMAELPREVAGFDPRRALDGGPDGLAAIRAIVSGAPSRLAPGGVLLVEVGAGQAGAAAGLTADAGLSIAPERDVLRDLAGIERVVRGRLAH